MHQMVQVQCPDGWQLVNAQDVDSRQDWPQPNSVWALGTAAMYMRRGHVHAPLLCTYRVTQ